MGSVVAFLSRSGPPAEDTLRNMASAAPHRGEVLSSTSMGQAMLGVTSGDGVGIADVASGGDMAAAFVGDFDNIDALSAELETAGEPTGRSPAGVLLAAFRAFGINAPGKLRGVFGAVVTDGRTLWAFRDQVGFHPLYCREEPRGGFVATEIKQVVAGSGIRYEPDEEAITNLFYNYVHSETDERRCALRGVQRIPRGHVWIADQGMFEVRRYWFPERRLESVRLAPGDVAERFHALMSQATARALRGNDAVSLSGGVDSPAVAAYAAPTYLRRTGRRLPALSALYPDFPSVDEKHYIQIAARELDLPLHTYDAKARPTDDLCKWVKLFDGPAPVVSLAETYENLTHARALGFRNVLTGEFAEFVCDMGYFTLDYMLAMGRVRPALHYHARTKANRPFYALGRRAIRAWLPATALRHYRAKKPQNAPLLVPWIDQSRMPPRTVSGRRAWREDQLAALEGAFPVIESESFIQSVAGVGTRRPFADVDLWEFFLSLPAEVKHPVPGRKPLLRRLLRGRVPDAILDRRDKTVFDAAIIGRIDYETLDNWLMSPAHQIPGVRYDMLADRLRQRNLTLVEFMRAKDLAAVHAFLSCC